MNPIGLTALVTGSGHRVGRALALALTEAGANVAVHYNTSDEAAAETVAALKMAGGRAEAFQADFTDAAEVERLFEAVDARMGPVQILANNAAKYERGELSSSAVEEWDRCMAVNVRAPYLLAKAMANALPEGLTGKIVNIGDSRTIRRERFVYGVSKAALRGLTVSLAESLAPAIQVNEIALGAVLQPIDTPRGDRPRMDRIEYGPIKRMGTLNEVAHTMMWLIENDYVTGETVHLDGGRTIR